MPPSPPMPEGFPTARRLPVMRRRPTARLPGRWAAATLRLRCAPITIDKPDYEALKSRLAEIQDAYGRGDLTTLRRLTAAVCRGVRPGTHRPTPRGVVDNVSNARLIQRDVTEACVNFMEKMQQRFALLRPEPDRRQTTGRVVSGSTTTPEEVTEVRFFRRPPGGNSQDFFGDPARRTDFTNKSLEKRAATPGVFCALCVSALGKVRSM